MPYAVPSTTFAVQGFDAGTKAGIEGLWGTSSADIWAAGDQGVIRHWNGKSWSAVDSTVPAGHLYLPWGASANDAWIPGRIAASIGNAVLQVEQHARFSAVVVRVQQHRALA